ncbi:hypothetical protein FXN63_26610 [Pigmentiphaga aceris]|uniref:Uncharacterized protein n=1 Tax=Pigmentiphaga aceris TaxID=1940612 RepID=A0A5C0B2F6_9BURK|nr:hypothetical protein [Pigmentiphaga aceris]QEI09019.1 hypothetical protein FXN63_26610 [Pigmentiphaga aceris]
MTGKGAKQAIAPRKLRRALIVLVVLAMLWPAYSLFYAGVPYRERNYSPNGQFYAQKFRLYSWDSWIPRMGMPGGGSDYLYYIDGYVRVYTAAGKLLGEIKMGAVPIADIHWAGDALVVMGDGDGMVNLPGPSE